MLLPEDNHFICESKDCEFKTCDIYEFLDHCGIEYVWGVKLSRKYTLDLFMFLQVLNQLIDAGDLDTAYDHVQSISLLLVNSSGEDLDNFIEESIVQSEMDDVMFGLEKMLKENE